MSVAISSGNGQLLSIVIFNSGYDGLDKLEEDQQVRVHLQFPPILLNHDHNLLHHLSRGERVRGGGKGEGREGRGGEGRTHLCMSTRVYRKPRGRRKVGMLLQCNRLVEMVLRKGRKGRWEGGREEGREGEEEGGRAGEERKRKKKH